MTPMRPVSQPRSLASQLTTANALVATATVFVAVAIARLDLGIAFESSAFAVLLLAVLVSVLMNSALVRRRVRPLERLVEAMEATDLSDGRVPKAAAAGSVDVERLQRSFGRMLTRLQEERREAGRQVLRAHEAERARVAQDLHDEVNQALTAVLLRLEATIHRAPDELRGELTETKRLATRAMEELLALARELRPTALDDLGLDAALRMQVEDYTRRTGIAASFTHSGPQVPLTPDQELVIYRVTQESLSNAAKHAGAEHVTVELSTIGGVVLAVRDDGAGFDQRGARSGLGLSGMRERALGVGGRLSIHAAPGQGTTVELSIPT